MASFEAQLNFAFLETSAGFGLCWYFKGKVFIFRGYMLRDREGLLDHILHHCEFSYDVYVILFTPKAIYNQQ